MEATSAGLSSTQASVTAELMQSHSEVQDATDKVAALQQANHAQQGSIDALERAGRKTQEMVVALNTNVSALEAANAELTSSRGVLAAELLTARTCLNDARDDAAALDTANVGLRSKRVKLETELAETELRSADLNKGQTAIRAELQTARTQLHDAASHTAALEHSLQLSQDRLAAKTTQARESEAACAKLQAASDIQAAQLSVVSGNLAGAAAKLTALEQSTRALQEQVVDLEVSHRWRHVTVNCKLSSLSLKSYTCAVHGERDVASRSDMLGSISV